MKIVIRRGVFETNSSSNHSLILTNKEKFKEMLPKLREETKYDHMFNSYEDEENYITSKMDKCCLLSGVFEREMFGYDYECDLFICNLEMLEIYKVFRQVLKDNNEYEILKELKEHLINFNKNNYGFFCEDYFEHGVLCDCYCNFLDEFSIYYDVELYLPKKKYVLLDVDGKKVAVADKPSGYDVLYKKLYDKFYEYIYGEAFVIPYESL